MSERDDLDAARRALEQEIHGLRGEMEETLGWAPRAAWAAPLVGLAAGFSLALWLARPKRRRRLTAAPPRPPLRRRR